MNSLVRKALLGTKSRRGPFFTIVYLHIQIDSMQLAFISTAASCEEQCAHTQNSCKGSKASDHGTGIPLHMPLHADPCFSMAVN